MTPFALTPTVVRWLLAKFLIICGLVCRLDNDHGLGGEFHKGYVWPVHLDNIPCSLFPLFSYLCSALTTLVFFFLFSYIVNAARAPKTND